MIGFALNSDNDIIIENGNFKLVEDGAHTVQAVRSRLLAYLNEWFLDTSSGVPYFEKIFIKPANLGNVESILKQKILQTPGVNLIVEFTMVFDRVSRGLEISFSAETDYGIINNLEVTINV